MGSINGQESCIILKAFMIKRAQLKSRISKDNFKQRWFLLRASSLSYHDGTIGSGPKKLKSIIELKNVTAVEPVSLTELHKDFTFQVVYKDEVTGVFHPLYIVTNNASQMEDWVQAIRRECLSCNAELSPMVHVGFWYGKLGHFTCCLQRSRYAPGCSPATCSATPALFGSKKGELPPIPVTKHSNGHIGPGMIASSSLLSLNKEKYSPHGPSGDQRSLASANGELVQKPPQMAFPKQMRNGSVSSLESQSKKRIKMVAKYSYSPRQSGDLLLERGEQYDILDDSAKDWWVACNQRGEQGLVPANYMQVADEEGLWRYVWYSPGMTRDEASLMLMETKKDGCFLVRDSSDPDKYSVSLYCSKEGGGGHVKHYHIQRDINTRLFYFAPQHSFESIPELVNYHKHNCGGLATRLKSTPNASDQPSVGKFEFDPSEVQILHEVGHGEFGKVYFAKYRGLDVAVKMMKEGAMSEQSFIEEARTMIDHLSRATALSCGRSRQVSLYKGNKVKERGLQHTHLVQLYGVCINSKPLKIVTEFMEKGSLLQYLRANQNSLFRHATSLLDICLQVCKGMAYLEDRSCIHRDLAARNCLVNDQSVVKVADFGLARHVLDDQYTSSHGTKFPIRWTSPEIISFSRFSSKSDVWAFGVLMWEVYSGGKMPYGNLDNSQVIELLQDPNKRLLKPRVCPDNVFLHMHSCWHMKPGKRPSFHQLQNELQPLKEPELTI